MKALEMFDYPASSVQHDCCERYPAHCKTQHGKLSPGVKNTINGKQTDLVEMSGEPKT